MKKAVYLVVTPFFPSPETWRGAFCYDFVQALRRMGRYDVRVFVPGYGEDYDYQGVHVYRFPVKMLPSGLLPFFFRRQNEVAFLRKVTEVGIALENVAVCHGHTAWFGIYPLAVKARNPSCVSLLHHHDPASFGLRLGGAAKFWVHRAWMYVLLRRVHEAIDGHVFISRCVERSFREAPQTDWSIYAEYRRKGLRGFRPANIRETIVLHNGVDCRRFTVSGRISHLGFVMGCVANMIDWKGHLTLLRAVARVRGELGNWRLRLVGSGPLLKACRELVAREGLEERVSFETEVDHTQLPEFYRSLDLFVLPSYFEGFGCVFTEAWACGTPFITCEGQGMDDLILPEERKFWLCKPMNPGDLAEKILHFCRHRPKQHLSGPIDIDVLVPRFVGQVEALRGEGHWRPGKSGHRGVEA